MASLSRESRIILAIEAIRLSEKLSARQAAKIYNVPKSSLQARMNGRTPRRDYRPKTHKLTETEEEAIIQYILDLDMRGFPPRLAGVEDMANLLLVVRDAGCVGKLWAERFVKRRPELKMRFNRAYDYQSAL